MVKMIILEGGRGVGKSTLASRLRQSISQVSLFNLTGFHLEGEVGLRKISSYYDAIVDYLEVMAGSPEQMETVLLFDRFFFTEKVFSELLNKYDFDTKYNELLERLITIPNLEVSIVYLTCNNKSLAQRLGSRDKVAFSSIKDDDLAKAQEIMELYGELMSGLSRNRLENQYSYSVLNSKHFTKKTFFLRREGKILKLMTLDTSNINAQEVYNFVKEGIML